MIKPSTEVTILKDIVKNEELLNLYDVLLFGFPLWRILRFRSRTRLLKIKIGYEHNTKKRTLLRPSLILDAVVSLYSIVKVCIFFEARENIIFAFPRLQRYRDQYLDKFSDPVILNSKLKDSCYVFQKPLAGVSYNSRFVSSRPIVKTDFIDRVSLVVGYVLMPFVLFLCGRKILKLYNLSRGYFSLNKLVFFKYCARVGSFSFSFCFYYLIFTILKPKRVFVVDREVFFPVIRACKVLRVPTFELQHGATYSETPLYSGNYDKRIDPDYFLVFGDLWKGPQFGIPMNLIINIGWGYREILKSSLPSTHLPNNHILVISEPPRSEEILSAISLLASHFVDLVFHIRLHPQESYSDNLVSKVSEYKNILVVDNNQDSYRAISMYNSVVGENSTVLYEALSLNKKVARLCIGQLEPFKLSDYDGFTYIYDTYGFKQFIESDSSELIKGPSAYNSFNSELVNNLPMRI